MDNFLRAGPKEVNPLNLGPEHIPFPCSLRELVLDHYAEPPGAGGNAHPMATAELVDYLSKIDDFSISPWVAVMEKTDAIGDPATPSREHSALMRWLAKALEMWEKDFPLESRLATQLRRLKPLFAALAVTDPRFLTPGAHAIHQLCDSIQARGVGWQSRLDRVGAALEEQVTRAIDDSRHWFEQQDIDLNGVYHEFTRATERDQARAQRMLQRVVETESGKVRTAAAKQEAARMINTALASYTAPEEIGELIKGPWYTSAQLLLLKFGLDSEEWRSMSTATTILLNSMQSLEDAEESHRQEMYEVVTQLPREMRRWLLSLHHDTEAVNEAMGLVESTHTRILRQQDVDLQTIEPLVVEDDHLIGGDAHHSTLLKKWSEGQWFSLELDGTSLRAQLALKIEQSQQLLFTNMAGIKVLQLSFAEFGELVAQSKVQALQSGASFSLCLARAAGVNSVEILEALASAMKDTDPGYAPEPPPESLQESGAASSTTTLIDPFASLDTDGEGNISPKPQRSEDLSVNFLPTAEVEIISSPDESSDEGLPPEIPGIDFGDDGSADVPPPDLPPVVRDNSVAEDFTETEEEATGIAELIEPSAELKELDPIEDEARKAFEEETRRFLADEESAKQEAEQAEEPKRHINLPAGVWIGFHDGETPTMARLAVHDPDEDRFIFVNRTGVKVRQVNLDEFLALIDNNLVEILEASSNFRDAVTEIRNKNNE